MRKLKLYKITVISNCLLVLVMLGIFMLGFVSNGTTTAANQGNYNAIYHGNKDSDNVSLMFNVYENPQVVMDIVNVLNSYGAKSTFFFGGCFADDNAELLNYVKNSGHELANHGYFHKDHKKLSYEQNYNEIVRTNKVITALTGQEITLFAPPSGSFGVNTLKVCFELDLRVVIWSKDTIDWRDKDSNLIFKRATKGVSGGDFILMHPKQHTLDILPKILEFYANNGLNAVTVSKNLQN